jgi:hypothetical protein
MLRVEVVWRGPEVQPGPFGGRIAAIPPSAQELPMLRILILSLIVTSSIALAQGTIYIPDNQSAVGTCNAIPLSAPFAAASTYVARIPASFMDPAQTRVDDIAFAPCNAATFSASSCQMGLGHVPNPLPNPFMFPTFDVAGNVTALGSFIDYHPIYNSVNQGPWTYNMLVPNTWNAVGFGGTTGFIWDGTNDVGYFLTFSGATGGTTCHRTATEPFRAYASGTYQAAASSGSGAAGLKMALSTSPAGTITTIGTGCPGSGALVPVLSTTASPTIGNASFHLDVAQGLTSAPAFLYASIGIAAVPLSIGGGCNVYLDIPSALALLSTGFNPIGPLFLDAGGAGTFLLPVPADIGLAGLHAGFQVVVSDAGAVNGFTLTNALEAVIN